MTAPVGAVDHARARAAAEWWARRADDGATSNVAQLGRAYLDLDARLNAACDALARVMEEADEFVTTQMDPQPWHHAFLRIRSICGEALTEGADAIDAAHGGTA